MNKTTELQQSNAANLVMSVRKEKGTESILGCSEVTELLLQNSLQAFWWSGFSPKLCHPHAFYRPHSPGGQTTPSSFCKKRWSVQHLNGTIRKSQNALLHNLSAHNYLSGSSNNWWPLVSVKFLLSPICISIIIYWTRFPAEMSCWAGVSWSFCFPEPEPEGRGGGVWLIYPRQGTNLQLPREFFSCQPTICVNFFKCGIKNTANM